MLQKGRLGFYAGGRAVTVEDRTRPVPNHLSCGWRSQGPLGAEAWEGRRLPPLGLRPAGLWVLRGSGRGGPCTEAPLAGGTQACGPRPSLALAWRTRRLQAAFTASGVRVGGQGSAAVGFLADAGKTQRPSRSKGPPGRDPRAVGYEPRALTSGGE